MGEKLDWTDEPSGTEKKLSDRVVTAPASGMTIAQALASQPRWLW